MEKVRVPSEEEFTRLPLIKWKIRQPACDTGWPEAIASGKNNKSKAGCRVGIQIINIRSVSSGGASGTFGNLLRPNHADWDALRFFDRFPWSQTELQDSSNSRDEGIKNRRLALQRDNPHHLIPPN